MPETKKKGQGNMMQQKFQEYARLLVRIGVNIQKGQRLIISCPVECAWFARLCAEEAYACGCREVVWKYPEETGFYQPIVIAKK